jgi:hypothetical protein
VSAGIKLLLHMLALYAFALALAVYCAWASGTTVLIGVVVGHGMALFAFWASEVKDG